MQAGARREGQRPEDGRFTPDLMYSAASLYYLQDATQAEIADHLGMSRATVSRLLSEARRVGIVRIDVVSPVVGNGADLGGRIAGALGLKSVRVAPYMARTSPAVSLAPALSSALAEAHLRPGDVLLISSGRAVYEAAQAPLPNLPGVVVCPTVGGMDEVEPWYQTNELSRQIAAKVGGTPVFLYAPALPSVELHDCLVEDHASRRVFELWENAQCILMGIGAPPSSRSNMPSFVPSAQVRAAAGDVCTRWFDDDGGLVPFDGIERHVAIPLDVLRKVPTSIAVAHGIHKVRSILAAARAGFFKELVTDIPTASGLLAELEAQGLVEPSTEVPPAGC